MAVGLGCCGAVVDGKGLAVCIWVSEIGIIGLVGWVVVG